MEIQRAYVKRRSRPSRPLFVEQFDSSSSDDDFFGPSKRPDERDSVSEVRSEEIQKIRQKLLELNLSKVSFASVLLSVKRSCICPICHLILLEATLLTCGHVFCDFCIRQWLRHSWTCASCGAASATPVTKRIWVIDTFLSDFHLALQKLAGENWEEDSIPESQADLCWSFDQMKAMMAKPPAQTPIMSAGSRAGLIERRQTYLAGNPIQWTEHGGNSLEGRIQFFCSYLPSTKQWVKVLVAAFVVYGLLRLDAHFGVTRHVHIRCGLIALLLTWAGRRIFYYSVDDDWNTTPNLMDWFFLEAFGLDPDEDLGAPDDQVVNAVPWDALVEAALASKEAHRHQSVEARNVANLQ